MQDNELSTAGMRPPSSRITLPIAPAEDWRHPPGFHQAERRGAGTPAAVTTPHRSAKTPSFSASVEALSRPDIADWIAPTHSDIDSVAYVLNVDPHYLSAQVRLHIPYYSEQDLESTPSIVIVRRILQNIKSALERLSAVHTVHRELNGANLVAPGSVLTSSLGALTAERTDDGAATVAFGEVPASFGMSLQEHIHYIHSARLDTEFQFGLRFADHAAPFCYAAFSALDRAYLLHALRSAVGGAFGDELTKVAVMTRAYGYTPTPKNAMSKLFDLSARALQAAGYNWIITAINPFLGFKGSIFAGASYFPFATSPMKYRYTARGGYSTRRGAIPTYEQRMITPPILWLARPLGRQQTRRLQKGEVLMYNVTDAEYAGG